MSNKTDDNILIDKSKSGDIESLNLLINKYSKFVMTLAHSFKNLKGLEPDDLYQEGMLGLLSAVYSYNPNTCVEFSSYLNIVVKRKMISAIRTTTNGGNSPLVDYKSIDDGFDSVCETSSIDSQMIFNDELSRYIDFANKNLSKIEKKVFKLRIYGMTYDEISDMLDISIKSVDNAVQIIRNKIKKII